MSTLPHAAPRAATAPSTGAEVMEAIRDGVVAPPPAATLFGLEVLEVEEGRIAFGFRTGERFSNWSTTHGGVLAGLTDFALTTAVFTAVPLGADVVTTNLSVTFVRPLPLHAGQVRVEGVLVHLGRTLAHAEVTVRDDAGGLVVRASGTCRVRRASLSHPVG